MIGTAAAMSLPAGAANNSSYLVLQMQNLKDQKVINKFLEKVASAEEQPSVRA